MPVTLYGRRTSLNVQKVLWALAELGVPHTQVDVGGAFGGTDTAAYRTLSPTGLIPTLVDGEHTAWESNACVRHLVQTYGDGWLIPKARAQADSWMDWCSLNFNLVLTEILIATIRTPRSKISAKTVLGLSKKIEKHAAVLDKALERRDFLVGEHLSMADIVVGANLYRYFELDFVRQDFFEIERYYQMLSALPAYRKNVMVSFESLRVPDSDPPAPFRPTLLTGSGGTVN